MAGNKLLLKIYISLQGFCLFSNAELLHDTHNNTIIETDPCLSHTTLNDAWRQVNNTEVGNHCDRSLVEGWYKAYFPDNPASIPRVCIKGPACGVPVPLHIQFTNDPEPGHFGEANVCGSFQIYGKWDCCVFENQIRVKNCGDFYVYRLIPQDNCNVGYCLLGESDDVEQFTAKTGETVDSDEHVLHGRDFSSLRNPRQTPRVYPDHHNPFINTRDHPTLEDGNSLRCQYGYLPCADKSECFLNTTRCDDNFDCVDRSDEENCPEITYCYEGLYMCPDGRCIDLNRRDCEPTSTTQTTSTTTTTTPTTTTTTSTTTTTPTTTTTNTPKTTTKTTTSTSHARTEIIRNTDTTTSVSDTTYTTSRTSFVFTFAVRGNDRTHKPTSRFEQTNHSLYSEQQLSSEHEPFSASPVLKSMETNLYGTDEFIMPSVYLTTTSSFNETNDYYSRASSVLYKNTGFHETSIAVTPLKYTSLTKNILSSSSSFDRNATSATEFHMSYSTQYPISGSSITNDASHIFSIRYSHGSEVVIPSSETVQTMTRNILEPTSYETQTSDIFGSIVEQFNSSYRIQNVDNTTSTQYFDTTSTQYFDTKSQTTEIPRTLLSSSISKVLLTVKETTSTIEGLTSVLRHDSYTNQHETKLMNVSNSLTSSLISLKQSVVQYTSVSSSHSMTSFVSFSSAPLSVSTTLTSSYPTETYLPGGLATSTLKPEQEFVSTLTENLTNLQEISISLDAGSLISSSSNTIGNIPQTSNITTTPHINNMTLTSVTDRTVETLTSPDITVTPYTNYVSMTSLTNNITMTTDERDIFTDNLRLFISVIVVGTVFMITVLIGIICVRHKARAGNWTCQREEYYARCEKDLLMKTKQRTSIYPDDDLENEENHMMENTSFYLSFEEIDTRPASVPVYSDNNDGLVIPLKELEAIESEDNNTQF